MEVIEYLKKNGIAALTAEYAIKVKVYDEGLMVLGYDQIDSPKAPTIVRECRGLILDNDFNVVSRSFDRFFNYGEMPETQAHLDWSRAYCAEKVDGSLIKIYYWNGLWRISTRGTAFAESTVNGFPETFAELVLKALSLSAKEFQDKCNLELLDNWTYIFELTCMENRVVKVYSGYTLHYLGSRSNLTGDYGNEFRLLDAILLGAKEIQMYHFGSARACEESAKHLPDLEEGYVVYQDGVPVCKIKSPTYVAVHHIRGEGLNPKRISQIVLTNETEEYLKYFPEDAVHFAPYVSALGVLKASLEAAYTATLDIVDQKEFAMAVKGAPYSGVLFTCKKLGTKPSEVFNDMAEPYKIKLLGEFVK